MISADLINVYLAEEDTLFPEWETIMTGATTFEVSGPYGVVSVLGTAEMLENGGLRLHLSKPDHSSELSKIMDGNAPDKVANLLTWNQVVASQLLIADFYCQTHSLDYTAVKSLGNYYYTLTVEVQ